MGLHRPDGRHLGALVVEQLKRSDALGMVLSALLIVAIPGALVNNLQNSGSVPAVQTSCPSGEQLSGGACMSCANGVCYIVQNVGCQTTGTNPSGNCALAGSAVSFLNSCSPFTYLMTFNFLGFISSFFTNCGTPGTSAVAPPPANITLGAGNETFASCANLHEVSAIYDFYTVTCPTATPQLPTQYVSPFTFLFTVCSGSGAPPTCWNGVIGNSTVSSTPSKFFVEFVDSSSPSNNTATGYCLSYGDYHGQPFLTNNAITTMVCSGLITGTPVSGGTSLNASGILGFFLSLFGAILLVILGLGVGITTPSAVGTNLGGVSTNPQGSKMAQAFGIGMLLWGAITSEFLSWTSYLPYGLDILMPLGLTALMFFGMWQYSQSVGLAS